MIGRLAIVGVVALALIVVVTQAGGGKAAQATIAQSCPGGPEAGVTVSFVWPAAGEGASQTFLDVGLDTAFTAGQFQAYGPFDPALTAYALAGLPEGVLYHYRVQSLMGDEWKLNARGTFTTACGVPPTPGDVSQRCVEGPEPGDGDDGVSATFSWKSGAHGDAVDRRHRAAGRVRAGVLARVRSCSIRGGLIPGRRPRAGDTVLVAGECAHTGRLAHERDGVVHDAPLSAVDLTDYRPPRRRGSRTSRSASPNMLKPYTTSAIARPGHTACSGYSRKTWTRLQLSMTPHDGNGGGMPYPRKLIVASARIAVPMPMLASTITTGSTFGMTWRTDDARVRGAERARRIDVLVRGDRDRGAAHDADRADPEQHADDQDDPEHDLVRRFTEANWSHGDRA